MTKKWTEQDIDYLKKNIAYQPANEIAKYFKVSYNSIIHKIHSLGLSIKKATNIIWSVEEDYIIQQHFEYAPKNLLLQLLPNRTWPAIYQRGSKTFHLIRKSQDKYSINYRALDQWNEFTAYLLGFTMADGYIKHSWGRRRENALQFELAGYDKDILDKIKTHLEYEGPVIISKRGTAKLTIGNVQIINQLIEKGVPLKDKTHLAAAPEFLPSIYYKDFVRGLFDGDGSIYLDNGQLVFQLLGTQRLLEAIRQQYLPYNLGQTVTLYDRSNSGANIFCLKIKNKHTKDLFQWIYKDADIYLDRKYQKYCQYTNSPSYGKPCEDIA